MTDDQAHDEAAEPEADAPTDGPEPDALSRLVRLLAEERIIQPSLAEFLR